MADNRKKLFTDFPPVTTEQWMEKITADLKGADFDKKLVWKTNEGFNVKPFYRQEDVADFSSMDAVPGVFPYVRGTKTDNEWFVRQEIIADDAKVANAKALEILNKGVNSLGFDIKRENIKAEFIATLLKDIKADCVELNFSTCIKESASLVSLLVAYFASNNYDVTKLQGSVNFDPINNMMARGIEYSKEEVTALSKNIVGVAKVLPNYRVLNVNGISLSNAGAYIFQELAYSLAWGNEYLSQMIDAGVGVGTAGKSIKFNLGVGSNYFMEIAKFRAGRLLWAKIVAAYKPELEADKCSSTGGEVSRSAEKMIVHAITSSYNKTIYDANVNMLRTQTEAMSASLGGVHSLTITPYDSTFKASDDFSERIARNQQLLLKEESNFDKVVDPSAGSYYIETLTKEIAAKAWELFLSIEDNGGFYASVKAGEVQKAVKATATARLKAVSARKEILLGTNQYPNFSELGAKKVILKKKADIHSEIEVLEAVRASQEFETLRFETEAGKRPKAFMLTIGSLAFRLARAQFSCNFFACAGYEVVDNLGFKTIEEGVEAAQKAGADIIVLCSSDDEYVDFAPEANKVIAGKQLLVVAGAPACMEDLKSQGIEHFINVRTNVLETLKTFNSILV